MNRAATSICWCFSILWRAIVLLSVLLCPLAEARAESRGLRVSLEASDANGAPSVGEVRLYSESHALVIGIDDYTAGFPRLTSAIEDAKEIAAELEQRGFSVQLETNLDADRLEDALEIFYIDRGIDPDARLFVWFAGHGVTYRGNGYIVPADAPIPTADPRGFRKKALALRDIGRMVREADSKHAFAVFDSCFSGTIFDVARAAPPSAITRVTTLPVRQFLSSGDADQQVSDNGQFRKLFIDALHGERRADANADGYLTASELGMFMADRISNYTENMQTPRYGKLRDPRYDRGDFVFLVRRPEPPRVAAVDGAGAALGSVSEGLAPEAVAAAEEARLRAFWAERTAGMAAAFARARAFEGRDLPGGQKVDTWRHFLARYTEDDPYTSDDEMFRKIARARLQSLGPKLAYLTVRSNVVSDVVIIDGSAVGSTGPTAHELEAGAHTVRVEKAGFEPFEERVSLPMGERRTIRAELAPRPTQMVQVPEGSFWYGCNDRRDRDCDGDEKPGRRRSADAFRIDLTEVTARAYGRCVAARACSEPETGGYLGACTWGVADREDHPVNCVDWNQARAYCDWRGARLPREFEWEKAARGARGWKYSWGNKSYPSMQQVANIAGRTAGRTYEGIDWAIEEYDDGYPSTSPVGSFPQGASPFGALDMLGNVWEWTADWYTSDEKMRVVRGGSWGYVPEDARASSRGGYAPTLRSSNIGFRCAE